VAPNALSEIKVKLKMDQVENYERRNAANGDMEYG
jgi:hypothetical protein